ncbi:MAG: DUF3181 family protein [Cyanobacteria bacterium P01_A01_bin.135]
MANSGTSEAIEKLAAEIGDKVYIDVANWHLYLQDAQLHTAIAQQVYPMLSGGDVEEGQVEAVLEGIPVKLGGGKQTLPLSKLIPAAGHQDLMEVLQEYQRQM